MNTKLVVLLGGVGAVHLVAGGLFLAGGCTQEDPPMPPGIYVPKQPEQRNTQPATPETAVQTTEPVSEPVTVPETPKAAEAQPGEKAKAEPAGGSGHGDRIYIVVKNDSLWVLARKNGLTVEELASYNNLPANAKLKVGQKIYIPANGKKALKSKPVRKAGAKGKKTAGKKAAPAKRGKNLPADGIYTIKAGDNFSVIAKRYGLKVSDIMAANPGVDSSRLKIGQKIRLTASAAAVPKQEKKSSKKTAPATDAESAAKAQDASAAPAPAPADGTAPSAAPSAGEGEDLLKKVDDVKPDAKAETPASNDAVKAVAPDQNDPMAVVPDKDQTITRDNGKTDVLVGADTTIDALAQKYHVSPDKVKEVNPGLPADGQIKTGTTVHLPE